MKYLFITTLIFFIVLFLTRNADAYYVSYPRPSNISQTITTRESFEGKIPCHDEIQIIDKELPHGEQINAYPKTVCK